MTVNQHPSVGDLLRARKEATGWSNREFEIASGDRVKAQTVDSMLNHKRRSWPKKIETLLGIASMLDVEPEVVVLAWAAELGVPIANDKPLLATRMPPGADKLTIAQQNAIIAQVRANISALDETSAAAHQEPPERVAVSPLP